MSRSGSTSSNLAKGEKFLKHLLYVQYVDREKDTASEISEISLQEYLLENHKIFSDINFAEYMRNPEANVGILKSALEDELTHVKVYSNPLPATPKTDVTIHAFVVFRTWNWVTKKETWYSIEKNGQYIVLQQSPNEADVIYKIYDAENNQHVQRLEPVELLKSGWGHKSIEYLLRAIWETNQLSTKYHLFYSNCQNFASFVFEKANLHGEKWSTPISTIVDRFRSEFTVSISPGQMEYYEKIKLSLAYDKFAHYKAMMERNRKVLEELTEKLASESLNGVDSQGYTLLEWATAFSTPEWPIDQFFKEKGAELPTDEGLFRRNVFFISLQYLPSSNKELEFKVLLLSFKGIDIHGVNQTGDTALHLALYGKKWEIAKKIFKEFPDYDVNVTNFWGDTPLHLAVKFRCETNLIKKILDRTNSENVNKPSKYGSTALHVAIQDKSHSTVNALLKRKDVNVNLKDNDNQTALHLASQWKNICCDLFNIILEKTTDVNAQDNAGNTVLHLTILCKSENATKEVLKRKDVDVSLKNKSGDTAFDLCSEWKDIPHHLFKIIKDKTADAQAQNEAK